MKLDITSRRKEVPLVKLPGEEWKLIPGHQRTLISSYGRIKRWYKKALYAPRRITVGGDGPVKYYILERLIAELWISKPPGCKVVKVKSGLRPSVKTVYWTKPHFPTKKLVNMDTFMDMLKRNETNYEIAAELDVSEKWVRNKLKELGIKRGKR
jgi:hypothetical protein